MAIPLGIKTEWLGMVVMSSIELNDDKKQALLACARRSIQQALCGQWDQRPAELLSDDNGASFVTLKLGGELRGCIGSLTANRPLMLDVWQNAYNAAFRDPRFLPLTVNEFGLIQVEVSVLTPAVLLNVDSEEALSDILRPGIDGVILEEGVHRATFLPAVWETLPEKEDFLLHLKRKAGLPDNYWSPTVRVSLYQAIKCSESPRE